MALDENKKKLLEQKIEFVPMAEYSRPGMVGGLQLPDGTILLNMSDKTSSATMGLYRKQMGAKHIIVRGTWTFVPDPVSLKVFENPHE